MVLSLIISHMDARKYAINLAVAQIEFQSTITKHIEDEPTRWK